MIVHVYLNLIFAIALLSTNGRHIRFASIPNEMYTSRAHTNRVNLMGQDAAINYSNNFEFFHAVTNKYLCVPTIHIHVLILFAFQYFFTTTIQMHTLSLPYKLMCTNCTSEQINNLIYKRRRKRQKNSIQNSKCCIKTKIVTSEMRQLSIGRTHLNRNIFYLFFIQCVSSV